MFACHLSKNGKAGGPPQCGRGTSTTSGISVSTEEFAMSEHRCGHCLRTNLGRMAVDRYAKKSTGMTEIAESDPSNAEELRLSIAHLRAEMQSVITIAMNSIKTNSADVEDWQADMKIIAERLGARLST